MELKLELEFVNVSTFFEFAIWSQPGLECHPLRPLCFLDFCKVTDKNLNFLDLFWNLEIRFRLISTWETVTYLPYSGGPSEKGSWDLEILENHSATEVLISSSRGHTQRCWVRFHGPGEPQFWRFRNLGNWMERLFPLIALIRICLIKD